MFIVIEFSLWAYRFLGPPMLSPIAVNLKWFSSKKAQVTVWGALNTSMRQYSDCILKAFYRWK